MKRIIFRAPVMTASGYGVHSRMLLRALVEADKYDITVMSVPWGATPLIYTSDPFLEKVKELSAKFNPQSPGQFDLSVQVTIPNEFQRMATRNIGITAGIEVDRVSPAWIKKVNEDVDVLVVPSKHSADSFHRTEQVNKPVLILPEWVDTSVFNVDPIPDGQAIIDFPAPFNFLAVGLGFDKPDGEDRKNFTSLVKWFCEQFRGREDVGLVLKASMVNCSPPDFHAVRNRIEQIKASTGCGQFPRVHLIHGRLSDRELAALYKNPRIKALVSLTHGEGFGLPIIEAAACGLPVVATDWSGHLDFLRIDGKNRFVPVGYELKDIPGSMHWQGVMEPGTKWAWPLENDAKMKMAKVVASYGKPKEWAGELAGHIVKYFSPSNFGQAFVSLIDNTLDGKDIVGQPTSPPARTWSQYDKFIQFVNDRKGHFKVGKTFTERKSLIYTMPGSAGDVFVSTAVVDSLRKKFPEHRIFFATSPQYRDILKGNPDIDDVIDYDGWMQNTRLMEFVFDEVYCPNYPVQTVTNNWIMNGNGRKLAEQFANHCLVELGEYKIQEERCDEFIRVAGWGPKILFHPAAGKGQWGARDYKHWQAVVDGINEQTSKSIPIIQVGVKDDREYRDVIDLRGKTTYNQLAEVVKFSDVLVGIDSFPMHLAAALGTPHVNIFGSSTPRSTGPSNPKGLSILLETPDRFTCTKPCYLNECLVDPANPCINNIPVKDIVEMTTTAVIKGKR